MTASGKIKFGWKGNKAGKSKEKGHFGETKSRRALSEEDCRPGKAIGGRQKPFGMDGRERSDRIIIAFIHYGIET